MHQVQIRGELIEQKESILPLQPLRHSNLELEHEINSRGGLYYVNEGDTIPPPLATIYQRLLRHRDWAETSLYEKRPCPIEFGLIFSSNLNAFAYTTPRDAPYKFDFIGLNIGTFYTFLNIFGRILSRAETFPNIGRPELEDPNIETLPYLTTDVYESNVSFQSPNCPVRSIFAGELAQLATEFFFFHELAHLRNGHVDFIQTITPFNYIAEAFDATGMENERLTRQTLENDADCGSLVISINLAYTLHQRFAGGARHPDPNIDSAMRAIYGNFKSAIDTLGYATYIAFRIFDNTEWSWISQPNFNHPLPLFRMAAMGPLLYEVFNTRGIYDYPAEQFTTDYTNTMIRAEIDCGLIKGDEPDVRGISDVLQSSRRIDYMIELESRWKEIRPLLDRYVRGGNLAP